MSARRQCVCSLDFSPIANGQGVDRAADALKRLGLRHLLFEIGGELRGEGVKPDGSPWWVALERPSNATCEEILVALHGLSVATSGDYRRYFEADGRRYSHSRSEEHTSELQALMRTSYAGVCLNTKPHNTITARPPKPV